MTNGTGLSEIDYHAQHAPQGDEMTQLDYELACELERAANDCDALAEYDTHGDGLRQTVDLTFADGTKLLRQSRGNAIASLRERTSAKAAARFEDYAPDMVRRCRG